MTTATRRRARFHQLEVAEVRPLTADSVEVTFAVPAELQGEYDYLPGQYVALRANVDGHEVRRSYSICRAPSPGRIFPTSACATRRSRWRRSSARPGSRRRS